MHFSGSPKLVRRDFTFYEKYGIFKKEHHLKPHKTPKRIKKNWIDEEMLFGRSVKWSKENLTYFFLSGERSGGEGGWGGCRRECGG